MARSKKVASTPSPKAVIKAKAKPRRQRKPDSKQTLLQFQPTGTGINKPEAVKKTSDQEPAKIDSVDASSVRQPQRRLRRKTSAPDYDSVANDQSCKIVVGSKSFLLFNDTERSEHLQHLANQLERCAPRKSVHCTDDETDKSNFDDHLWGIFYDAFGILFEETLFFVNMLMYYFFFFCIYMFFSWCLFDLFGYKVIRYYFKL